MKTSQNIPPHFDDEIGLLDIFHFFKLHKKFILTLMILGMILGGLFAHLYGPVYKGSALISPAKISGTFAVTPKNTLIRINLNTYYSKESFLNCNPYLDKDIDYDISNIVKYSITKDGDLIMISMQHKNKTLIKNCLDSIMNDIRDIQNIITSPLIQSKNNELMLVKEKLRVAEEFKNKLNYELFKELKKNSEHSSTISSLVYANLISTNNLQIKQTMAEIYKLTFDLSSEQTKEAEKIMPVTIKKWFPSVEYGALFGIFLGLCIGILIALVKQIKI